MDYAKQYTNAMIHSSVEYYLLSRICFLRRTPMLPTRRGPLSRGRGAGNACTLLQRPTTSTTPGLAAGEMGGVGWEA